MRVNLRFVMRQMLRPTNAINRHLLRRPELRGVMTIVLLVFALSDTGLLCESNPAFLEQMRIHTLPMRPQLRQVSMEFGIASNLPLCLQAICMKRAIYHEFRLPCAKRSWNLKTAHSPGTLSERRW